MKKSLLFSAALVAAGSALAAAPNMRQADASMFELAPKASEAGRTLRQAPSTRADESFDFTYAYEVYSALSLQNTTPGTSRVYMLFEMLPEDIKTYAGSKVTGFTVCSPTDYYGRVNTITDAQFFYTTDSSVSKADYTQDFHMSTEPLAYNKVSMDESYTITGEEEYLFFGYSLLVPEENDMYYVPVDYIPTNATAGVVGVSDTPGAFPAQYLTFGSDYGALPMSVTLERESFPRYASFVSLPSEIYLPLGKESTISTEVSITSGAEVESFSVEYVIDGQTYGDTYYFSSPMPAGVGRTFGLNLEFPAFTKKINEEVEFKITSIGGQPNENPNASTMAKVAVLSKVPERQTLYEEYTSTSCMWCTRGFAALEYIKKNYPSFVTASFHTTYSSPTDPMQVMTSFPSQVSGYPAAVLNRGEQVDPFYGSQNYMEMTVPVIGDILALNAVATPWDISVSHEWASDDVLVAKAEVANMLGYDNGNYKIAYILVADGLTGTSTLWRQQNGYYSQNADPSYPEELAAFCRGGEYGKSRVSDLVFNDVVVSADGVKGVAGSVPTSLAAEETASHSLEFDLSKISSTLIPDRNKLRVIAAVVDARGNVLNCAKDEVNDNPVSTAVEGIDSSDNAPAEYYNINGMKVAQPTEGIFIRRQGGKAEKIVIR